MFGTKPSSLGNDAFPAIRSWSREARRSFLDGPLNSAPFATTGQVVGDRNLAARRVTPACEGRPHQARSISKREKPSRASFLTGL